MRLIDADVLLETGAGIKIIIPKNCHPYEAIRIQGNAFRKAVEESPTIDAVEVVHGRWIEHEAYACWHYDCSNCDDGYAVRERDSNPPNYCSNCGAKMDGEREDDDREL